MEPHVSLSKSPSPDVAFYQPMTFPEAIQAVIDGKQITKQEWNDPDVYCMLRNTRLMIYTDEWHAWTINDGDLRGEDWIVLPDQEDQP